MVNGERRRSERILYRAKAESLVNDKTYRGIIENVSMEGILKIISNGEMLDIMPGTKVKINFPIPSGGCLKLDCEVRWLRHYPNMPHGIKHYIGMEIISPSDDYREFTKTLYMKRSEANAENG